MQRVIFTPTLYLRADKRKKNGAIPIYVRFQRINGKEPKFPLGIEVTENDWDETTHRPKDLSLKLIVDKKVTKIELEINNAVVNDIEITPALLKDFVTGKPKPEQRSFYDYFDEYVKRKYERGKIRSSTRNGYEVTRRALVEYRSKIRLSDINEKFLEGFERFLIKRGNASGKGDVLGTRSNRLKHVNTVLQYIERRGVVIENPYKKGDLEIPRVATNDVFLDFEDLKKLKVFSEKIRKGEVEIGEAEYKVLYMFLFSCATGLRIGDVMSLTWGDIVKENATPDWVISMKAQKTGRMFHVVVPVLGMYALHFTRKYSPSNRDKKIFCLSRNTVNVTLRRVVKKAGIDKYITYHSSRRTYATLAKALGVSEYALQRSMGHNSVRTTNDYMKWDAELAVDMTKDTAFFKMDTLLKKEE